MSGVKLTLVCGALALAVAAVAAAGARAQLDCDQKASCLDCLENAACVWTRAFKKKRDAADAAQVVLPGGWRCAIGSFKKKRDVDGVADVEGTLGTPPASGFVFSRAECEGICGDGVTDEWAGEKCDDGAANGTPASCCRDDCTLRPRGEQCRGAAGECDVAEVCDGQRGSCPRDRKKSSSTVCRVQSQTGCAGGPCTCDQPERCDGVSDHCPADGVWSAGHTCRAPAGPCDVKEVCDGSSRACPTDALAAAGDTCRASRSVCDVAEVCSGSDAACPADAFEPAGKQCRAASGDCDVEDFCTGRSAYCPKNYKPSSTVCREATGDCDVEERCTGRAEQCPGDRVHSRRRRCRSAAGVCDKAEYCDGSSKQCPDDAARGDSYVCRRQAGPCDEEEKCVGFNCPPDEFKPASTLCSGSRHDCEVDSHCPGDAAACPGKQQLSGTACTRHCYTELSSTCANGRCEGGNRTCQCVNHGECAALAAMAGDCAVGRCEQNTCVFRPDTSNKQCRASAGTCDVAERCDGQSLHCPADSFRPSTRRCRNAAGPCDEEEYCTGASADCPANELKPNGAVCREPAADKVCDDVARCDGSSTGCAPAYLESGTACVHSERCWNHNATCAPDASSGAKCVGNFNCECLKDDDCVPTDATSGRRLKDPCKEYTCLPDYSCRVVERDACYPVGRCIAGTAGCECAGDEKNECTAPLQCHETLKFCYASNALCTEMGLYGALGCPCADPGTHCFDPKRRKRAIADHFLRCEDGYCRISQEDPLPVDPCAPGSAGCLCRPAPTDAVGSDPAPPRCDGGLECNADGVCAAACVAGQAGCVCDYRRDSAGGECDAPSVCRQGTCVYFTEDCKEDKCTIGDPGCCCTPEGHCTQVQRRKRDVYLNVCNDGYCQITVFDGEAHPGCGSHDLGDRWAVGGRHCRCDEEGATCDTNGCVDRSTEQECHATAVDTGAAAESDEAAAAPAAAEAPLCAWGHLPESGDDAADQCFSVDDYPGVVQACPIGTPRCRCTTANACVGDSTCDEEAGTCRDPPDSPIVTGPNTPTGGPGGGVGGSGLGTTEIAAIAAVAGVLCLGCLLLGALVPCMMRRNRRARAASRMVAMGGANYGGVGASGGGSRRASMRRGGSRAGSRPASRVGSRPASQLYTRT